MITLSRLLSHPRPRLQSRLAGQFARRMARPSRWQARTGVAARAAAPVAGRVARQPRHEWWAPPGHAANAYENRHGVWLAGTAGQPVRSAVSQSLRHSAAQRAGSSGQERGVSLSNIATPTVSSLAMQVRPLPGQPTRRQMSRVEPTAGPHAGSSNPAGATPPLSATGSTDGQSGDAQGDVRVWRAQPVARTAWAGSARAPTRSDMVSFSPQEPAGRYTDASAGFGDPRLMHGATPAGDPSQSGQSGNGWSPTTTATIHLDGNALGSWVTRHLERTLSQPNRGPSSVDPRAVPGWGIMSGY